MDNFSAVEFDHGGTLTIPDESTTDRAPVTKLVYTVDYASEGYADFVLPSTNRVVGDTYIVKNLNGGTRNPSTQSPVSTVAHTGGTSLDSGSGYSLGVPYALWNNNQAVMIVWSDAYNLTGWFVVASHPADSAWTYDR